jgi:ABC-2 type transport system ATP-binding protein
MDTVITATNLTKYFGKHCALDSVSFSVPRGSVTAFLGRNGSGKSTTLRILLGLLEPTRGGSTILGHNSQHLTPEIRARVGYLAEGHPLIKWMTVRQSEKFQSAFFPAWNHKLFAATVDHFNLPENAKAGNLSRGQRAGLALALTLAAEPELLILDDPALGLDPVARRALLESILYITRDPGRTVLLSSHLLDDIERMAEYLLILDRSVLRAACTLEEFRERIVTYELSLAPDRSPETLRALHELPGLLDLYHTAGLVRLIVANPPADIAARLAEVGPLNVERLPTNFQDAVTAYMSDHRTRTFFLDAPSAGVPQTV